MDVGSQSGRRTCFSFPTWVTLVSCALIMTGAVTAARSGLAATHAHISESAQKLAVFIMLNKEMSGLAATRTELTRVHSILPFTVCCVYGADAQVPPDIY